MLFWLRLSVSPEHGWSWDTTTIKTHLPTYKESLADHTTLYSLAHLFAFGLIITFHSNSAQVADSRISKAQRFSGSLVYKLAQANLVHKLYLYSPLSSIYRTFVGIESTCDTITIFNRLRCKQSLLFPLFINFKNLYCVQHHGHSWRKYVERERLRGWNRNCFMFPSRSHRVIVVISLFLPPIWHLLVTLSLFLIFLSISFVDWLVFSSVLCTFFDCLVCLLQYYC